MTCVWRTSTASSINCSIVVMSIFAASQSSLFGGSRRIVQLIYCSSKTCECVLSSGRIWRRLPSLQCSTCLHSHPNFATHLQWIQQEEGRVDPMSWKGSKCTNRTTTASPFPHGTIFVQYNVENLRLAAFFKRYPFQIERDQTSNLGMHRMKIRANEMTERTPLKNCFSDDNPKNS